MTTVQIVIVPHRKFVQTPKINECNKLVLQLKVSQKTVHVGSPMKRQWVNYGRLGKKLADAINFTILFICHC